MKLDMTKRKRINNGRKKEITEVEKREEGINEGRKKRQCNFKIDPYLLQNVSLNCGNKFHLPLTELHITTPRQYVNNLNTR